MIPRKPRMMIWAGVACLGGRGAYGIYLQRFIWHIESSFESARGARSGVPWGRLSTFPHIYVEDLLGSGENGAEDVGNKNTLRFHLICVSRGRCYTNAPGGEGIQDTKCIKKPDATGPDLRRTHRRAFRCAPGTAMAMLK